MASTRMASPTSTAVPSQAPSFVEGKEEADRTPLETIPTQLAATVDAEKAAPAVSRDIHQDARTITGFKWSLVLIALYSTAFIYGLDNTISADIQPAIIERFGAPQKLAWIGTGFPLGSIATILFLGKAFGMFDNKWVYNLSVVLFAGGSALCGGANNMDALIIGRLIAGAGGAGTYLGILNYLSTLTIPRERPLYIAFIGLIWGIGVVLGPVIGGAFADSSATWRWAFYINLIICGALAPVYVLLLPAMQPKPHWTFWEKVQKIDWLGTFLSAAVYTTWVLALTFPGTQWRWSHDGRTVAMFVVFGVVTIAFVLQQYFSFLTTPELRVFPGQFIKRKSFVLLYFCTAAAASALFVPAYFIPLFFQFVKNDTAIMAAVRLLPFVVLNITFVMINGGLMPKFGYYMPWYVFGGIFTLIGGALMYTVKSTTSTSAVYGYSILIAVGSGSIQQAAYSVLPVKVLPRYHEIPQAVSWVNSAQIGSIVIALTISGTIFQNVASQKLTAVLAGQGFSPAEIAGAIAGTQSTVFKANLPAAMRQQAIDAIISAMDQVYSLVIVAGAILLISSLFLRREKLFMTMEAGG